MITAVIQIGRQTAAIELPQDRFSLQYWLAQMGIRERPENIPISNGKGQPISVTLDAESNIGRSLAALFTEKNTLDEANVCAHMSCIKRTGVPQEDTISHLYRKQS